MVNLLKLNDGVAVKYSENQLHSDNPTISFPKPLNVGRLVDYNVFEYSISTAPDFDENSQKLTESFVQTDGNWVLNYIVENIENSVATSNNRAKRDNLLGLSDWTQLADVDLTDSQKTSWATYRQSLRDITSHSNFPFLAASDWPVSP